tara:strand:- start:72 stop:389 length:318 start_codon:yes stop_codon:yes gene_type:complete
MTGWIKTWWPVIAGCAALLGYLITGSVQLGEMKNDSKHKHESAATERKVLVDEDKRIHKRIDKTDKRLSKVKTKTETMSEMIVQIKTTQSVMVRNQERILQKMER